MSDLLQALLIVPVALAIAVAVLGLAVSIPALILRAAIDLIRDDDVFWRLVGVTFGSIGLLIVAGELAAVATWLSVPR